MVPSFSLLFLLFSFCSDAAIISHLPGFSGHLPFNLETGYVGVDEVQLFYYFIESEGNPTEDPVVLWLTGGPGCSAYRGLVFEVGIEGGYQPSLNLKGYLIGNPVTGDKIDVNSKVPYLHGVGIISDELYESTTRSCEGEDHRSAKSAECAVALDAVQKFISEIETTHILDPKCAKALARPHNKRFLKEDYDELQVPPPVPDIWCRSYPYFLSYYWANNNITKEALHIEKGSVREWKRCNYAFNYIKDIPSSIKYHLNLTSKDYRALVYSGDHDTVIPFLGTHAWIRSLNFSIVDDW